MNSIDLSSVQPIEVAAKFIDMSNDEIRLVIAQLNPEQLSAVISYMNEKNTPYWKGKTRAIILGLSDRTQLESAGRYLSAAQILDFFESSLLTREDNFNKLLAILVGMTHQTFSQLLLDVSDDQLPVLLQTSFSEPLQHQITVFIHELNNRYLLFTEELDALFSDIQNLPTENIGRNEIISIKNRINDLSLEFNIELEKMRNALRIAWNSHRVDLIENLSALKEKYLHTLNNFIGYPVTAQDPTGLYNLLKEHTNTVFGNPENLNDPESLSNDEACIDALVKFSVWYLKDYWEVGLLTKIKNEDELELDPHSHSEQERLEYRDQLFSDVKENLEKLHLSTLKDLKKADIYSKRALIEYIQEHKNLIS